MDKKVIFIHGNGGGTAKDNWFPYVKQELEKLLFCQTEFKE